MNAPVVTFKDGDRVHLDRRLSSHAVANKVNDERERADAEGRSTHLLSFEDDQTPSRTVWLDPADVRSVRDE